MTTKNRLWRICSDNFEDRFSASPSTRTPCRILSHFNFQISLKESKSNETSAEKTIELLRQELASSKQTITTLETRLEGMIEAPKSEPISRRTSVVSWHFYFIEKNLTIRRAKNHQAWSKLTLLAHLLDTSIVLI